MSLSLLAALIVNTFTALLNFHSFNPLQKIILIILIMIKEILCI